jgi:predicted regulator of Ras-like GTPase activity (Roadblock/LC7/MglB family)
MAHEALVRLFEASVREAKFVNAINLSSADGFTHHSYVVDGTTDGERLSAVSSSLASLSNAATSQLMKTQLICTVIESTDGNMVLLRTRYRNKDAVLCFISDSHLNVGKTRYFARKLADAIVTIPAEKVEGDE